MPPLTMCWRTCLESCTAGSYYECLQHTQGQTLGVLLWRALGCPPSSQWPSHPCSAGRRAAWITHTVCTSTYIVHSSPFCTKTLTGARYGIVYNTESHKKFSEEKQAHVGMEASKTNQTRWESMTPQHLTWQSGTSAMFYSKFNGPIARGTTR